MVKNVNDKSVELLDYQRPSTLFMYFQSMHSTSAALENLNISSEPNVTPSKPAVVPKVFQGDYFHPALRYCQKF